MLPEVSGHSGTAEGASVELCSASKNGAPPPALRPQLCPGTRMAPGSGSLRLAAEQARTDPDWLSFPHPGATESRDPRGVSTRRMRGGHGGGTRARRRLGDDTHQRYVATTHRVRAVLHALCRQSAWRTARTLCVVATYLWCVSSPSRLRARVPPPCPPRIRLVDTPRGSRLSVAPGCGNESQSGSVRACSAARRRLPEPGAMRVPGQS